jgi:flagellar basal-body rod modification protein FlgD
MIRKTLSLGVGLLLLNFGVVTPLAVAQDCPPGNPRRSNYMLRSDDRRCEGINDILVSRDFGLTSLTIGKLSSTGKIQLTIPNFSNQEPKVRVQSATKGYQLDALEFKKTGNEWQFSWNDEVIQREKISRSSLRSLATINNNVVIPIRYGNLPKSSYNIHIYTGGNSESITLNIKERNGDIVYSKTLKNKPGKEVSFAWDGKNQQGQILPTGRYVLEVFAKVEQLNSAPEDLSYNVLFEHNPTWLK